MLYDEGLSSALDSEEERHRNLEKAKTHGSSVISGHKTALYWPKPYSQLCWPLSQWHFCTITLFVAKTVTVLFTLAIEPLHFFLAQGHTIETTFQILPYR